MSALIEVQDLTKVYPDGTRAVDDVSFEVQQGETFGFLGPNGAGKTTTIRILVTLLPKTGGAATVGGFDVERQPERVRSMIGYAGQFIGIDVDLTGRENLVLQGVLVIVVALAMGASIKTGIVGALVMLFVAACFGIVWAALSNVVALRTKNSEMTMMIGILLTFPLLFLSTAMMPPGLLPHWLETVGKFNPVTYVIDTARAFMNFGYDWTQLGKAIGVIALVGLFTLTGATRAFRKATS